MNDTLSTISYSFENSNLCVLNKETTIGPFYIANAPLRVNMAESQLGIPLLLGFKIVDYKTCKKIIGATIEIWHANAFGKYSGFTNPYEEINLSIDLEPENNERWLRARQITDELGFVEFATIYPGRYILRTNHIHLKVQYNSKTLLTTQLFFPQDLNNLINSSYPYNQIVNQDPVINQDDIIILENNGVRGSWLKIAPFGSKYIATLTIGVKLE